MSKKCVANIAGVSADYTINVTKEATGPPERSMPVYEVVQSTTEGDFRLIGDTEWSTAMNVVRDAVLREIKKDIA